MKNNAVSYAKAVAIILMVIAHAGAPDFFNRFVTMFHMPLFFFMSGFCFKEKYLAAPVSFIKKRILGLYWPFIKWGGNLIIA